MKIISFNLDRTVSIKDTEIVQNEMVYVDTKQAHFLNTNLVGFIVYPFIYGLFGKKKNLIVTANANDVNLLNPVNNNQEHFIVDEAAFDKADLIEDKIIEQTLISTEKNPSKKDTFEKYISITIIIGASVVAFLGSIVGIPYVINQL
tara:strand:+ start:397 stop:837 length:441 start_codon:yes stop_codon:yes gene_type:complete